VLVRRSLKNVCNTARHSAARMPLTTVNRWLNAGWSCTRSPDSIAPAGVAQGYDLGMRRGIRRRHRPVEAASDNFPAHDDDRAHRHFTGPPGLVRKAERLTHQPFLSFSDGATGRRAPSASVPDMP
jgi:hypothetical protein